MERIMGIRVLVADDHEVVRRGLGCLFTDSDVSIVGEASSGEEAVEQTRTHKPDVVVLDIRMPGMDGLDTLEKIKTEFPETRVVMLSTYDNPTYVARAVALGASDYVLKGSSREQILQAITRAAAGEPAAPESMLYRIRGSMTRRREGNDQENPLTNRELQVLRHVALGLSNREIGRSLTISIETVKEHVQNILRKIDVADRTQAAVWAVKRGLV
jgi:DNA-binding NarL/FixJ family response regulator